MAPHLGGRTTHSGKRMRQMITTTSANKPARTVVLKERLALIAPKCASQALGTTTCTEAKLCGKRPLKSSSREGVLQQTSNRHRTRTAWHRGNGPSHGLDCLKINITNDSGLGA